MSELSVSNNMSGNALQKAAQSTLWPFGPFGMQASDLLVVDSETKSLIEGHKPDTGPALCGPEMLDSDRPVEGRVFVLLRTGERAFARKLKQQRPNQEIISVTYGDALNATDIKDVLADRRFVVLVGAATSGKGRLAQLLAVNNVAQTVPAFTAISEAWSNWCNDYEFARHITNVLASFARQQNSKLLGISVNLEQLESMRRSKAFLPAAFKQLAARYQVKCLYFMNRNKFDLAALQHLVSETGVYSVDELGKATESVKPPTVMQLRDITLKLLMNETVFEGFLGKLDAVRVIAALDVETSPVAVVNALVTFLETGILRQVSIPEQERPYRLPAWYGTMAKPYVADMEEMLGIERNDMDSYGPKKIIGC